MASSATPAPGTWARLPRSTSIDLRTGRTPVAGLVLTLVLFLVLLGTAWVNVARLSADQDRVHRSYGVLRGLDVVLAHLGGAEAGRRGLLVTGQDDLSVAVVAGQEAVAGAIDTVAALTADSPVQQQRIRQLRALVQQQLTERRSTVGARRSQGLQAIRAVVLQSRGDPVLSQIRSLAGAIRAEEEGLLGVRRTDSATATQTTRGTLVVAGLVGLLLAAGAAAALSRGDPERARADERTTTTDPEETGAEGTGARIRGTDDLTAVTTGIAQQTDLLALDAAIEAARAHDTSACCAPTVPGGTGTAVAGIGEVPAIVAPFSDRRTPAIASLVGAGVPGAVAPGGRAADVRTRTAAATATRTPVRTPVFAAARSRAHGPTTALWHAVQLHRPFRAIDGSCELAVCGSLVRVSTEQRWPVAARDVCPACATLAH